MDVAKLRAKYEALVPTLSEQSRRFWAATEARAIGRGGVALVYRATGLARSTIRRGLLELASGELQPGRVRRLGGGRKPKSELDPKLAKHLDRLIEPTVSGKPTSPLRWTSKSVRKLAEELRRLGHTISHTLVSTLLAEAGYSLQANRKTREGPSHPDRDAQFRYLYRQLRKHQSRKQPVVSVDTKKKELVGNFKNGRRERRPKGEPERVLVHDFLIPEQGKAIPYGVYDVTLNEGWVAVGIDHDTASFAVNSIRRWWHVLGRERYPDAESLLITADCGGSNGPRIRLWKWELQQLANELGLAITVCHFPPGTSKWNKIEHRLFSYISVNWRGKPLTSLATIVNLIAATTTTTGLRVLCELDKRRYPKAVEVSDDQFATLNVAPHRFHGDWNYTVHPRTAN